ncbi:MAG: hypothetical protein AABY65_04325 [Nitrospirota bacterium]
MKRLITRREARTFKARWVALHAAEIKELRSTPIERKLRQLAALMSSVDALGWTKALAAEETLVRQRWNRLRRVSGGSTSALGSPS